MQILSTGVSAREPGSKLGVDRLLRGAALMGGIQIEDVASVARALLGVTDLSGLRAGISELNFNGSPLQLMVAMRKGRMGCRLLGDPGFHIADPLSRFAIGRAALSQSLRLAKSRPLRPIVEQLIEQVVPSDPQALSRYVAGTMWLAMGLGRPGLAVYAAPDPGCSRWEKARDWVLAATPAPEAALALMASVQDKNFLLGVGIEGRTPGSARLKIYWRMRSPIPLSSFQIPLFESPSIIRFLYAYLGNRRADPQAFNFSANFDLVQGTLRDIKVDVSWHDRPHEHAIALLHSQSELLGMATKELSADIHLMEELGLKVGCLGLGLDTAGEHRINTYLFQPN